MSRLQEWIHTMEEGGGAKLVRLFAAGLVFVVIALLFHLRQFQNFSESAAMDAAQVGRNLAEGRGFQTDWVRPFSLHLLREHSGGKAYPLGGPIPDLNQPPAYPWLLSILFRVSRPDMEVPRLAAFDDEQPAALWRHEAETRIAILNQALFLVSLVLLYLLGTRLFDPLVGWIAVIALGGAEFFWRISISGLPTMLSMALILALAHLLVSLERRANEKDAGFSRVGGLALLAGVFVGCAALTRYGHALLLAPAILFVGASLKERRGAACALLLAGFAVTVSPWMARNVSVCGAPLGAAGFALNEDSVRFPGDRLQRSLNPRNLDSPHDLTKVGLVEHWSKFWKNVGPMIEDELPRFGGSWMTAFFLAGLLAPFSRASCARLRMFVVFSLAALAAAALLTRSAGESNASSLLTPLAPLVFLFGAVLFSILLDQAAEPYTPKRRMVAGVFCLLISLPLILSLFSPKKAPLVYPPYHPPLIHEAADWFEEDEVVMCDVPWAMAWYGDQPAVSLTWDLADDFVTIHEQNPIRGLYLTSVTLDRKLVSELWEGDEIVWGRFAANSVVKGEVPDGFPLPHAFSEWFPFQLLMADRPRWEGEAGKE